MSTAPLTPNTGQAPEEQAGAPAHVKTKAEVTFDKAVYGGISYFAQAATGVVLTHWIRHGTGRRYFDQMAEWAGPRIISKITAKTGEDAVKAADSPIVVSTMIMVGNAFLLPVKWLENRKPEIVRGMAERENKRRSARGDAPTQQELAAQEQSLTELDNAPKQTWGSLIGGRAFGLAAVYAVLFGIGQKNNEMLENLTATSITGASDALGAKSLARNKTFENYVRISFYDMAYSAVSASGLYVYSHLINPPHKRKQNAAPQEPVLPPLEEAALYALDLQDEMAGKSTDPLKAALQPAPRQEWKNSVQPRKPASHAQRELERPPVEAQL